MIKKQFLPISVLISSSCFYIYSLAPTIIGGDSSMFCINIKNLILHFGKADDHPLYMIIGKIFSLLPFDLAYNINLMSAIFGSFTVLCVFLIIQHINDDQYAALFGAFALMVSHAFWLHSVIAEVYTLNALFIAGLLYLTINKINVWNIKFIFPVIFLIGLFNHLILILSLPSFLLYFFLISNKEKRKEFLKCMIILSVIGVIAIFLITIFYHDVLWKYIKGPPPIYMYILPPQNLIFLMKETLFYFLYLSYQFPLLGIVWILFGIHQLWGKNKAVTVLLLTIVILNALFFIKTTYWNSYGGTKYTFYISDYVIWSIFYGSGFIKLTHLITIIIRKFYCLENRPQIYSVVRTIIVFSFTGLTILIYSLIPTIVTHFNIDIVHARSLKYRDNNTFFLNPNKRGYLGNRKLGEEILQNCKKDAIVLADFTIYSILAYLQQIENKRTDLTLIHLGERIKIKNIADKVKKENAKRVIYIADKNFYYNLFEFESKYTLNQSGPIYEIIQK
ncbi:MAG: DUF2723 domain-containing protein [Pseudomonadota bacterium]